MKNIICLLLVFLSFNPLKAERYACAKTQFVYQQTSDIWPYPIGGPNIIHWANSVNIPWTVNSTGAGDGVSYSATQAEINTAFNSWQNLSTSNISFSYQGSTSNTWEYDGYNTIYWAEAGDPAYEPNGIFSDESVEAMTVVVYNSNFELLDVDIVFDGVDYVWGTDGTSQSDIQGVAAHEIGHMIGLHHTEVNTGELPTMFQYDIGLAQRSLEFDDEVGAAFLYGGNIITNKELLLPQNHFYWTVNVNAGKTLTISKNLKVQNNCQINVNGVLNAGVSANDRKTIERIGASGTWNGIVFYSGSSGSVQYCDIKNATTAITCNSTLPMIRYNNITDNGTGIYVLNVGTVSNEISYNTIQNNTSRGISLYSASPKIYSNTISNNTYYGISTYQSSPYLYGNTITGHSANGLNFSYYSSAKLVPWNAYGYYWGRGNNKIKNNTGSGISASYMSNLYLGSSPYGGYNSICNNTGTELSAYYNCAVTAQLNWWGAYPPNSSEFYPYQSTIDYTNALPTDPNPDPEQGMVRGPNGISNSSTINSVKSDLEKAYNLQLDGKFAEAIAMYDSFINANSTDSKSALALVRIDECYKLSGKEGAANYLDNMIKTKANKNNELDVVSLELKNQYLIQDKRFEEAVTNFNKLAETYKTNKDVEKHSLFNAGYVYLTYLNDYKNASVKFAELAAKYPDDELVSESEYLLGNLDANNRQNLASPNIYQSDLPVPTDYALDQNYPNPFNPSTTITYQLPKSGNVTLKIYDMLGKEVMTLVNEQKEMGRYSVQFNASSLASGMYVYQLRANDYTSTKKMLLLK